jgi:hypothetical protein
MCLLLVSSVFTAAATTTTAAKTIIKTILCGMPVSLVTWLVDHTVM